MNEKIDTFWADRPYAGYDHDLQSFHLFPHIENPFSALRYKSIFFLLNSFSGSLFQNDNVFINRNKDECILVFPRTAEYFYVINYFKDKRSP